MKNNYILSYNLNGWMPVNRKNTFSEKIKSFASYTKELYGEPAIIMLQEMIAGRGQKFLVLLKNVFPKYEVITPAFDYFKHPQSIMAVTLIRKDILDGFSVEVVDAEMPNRINCVFANMRGELYRIINTHMVQVANHKNTADWYVQDRLRLHLNMWNLILTEARKHKAENTIIAGDFQERKTAIHIRKISQMGYMMAGTRQATVNNLFFTDNHIDHIIFSPSAYKKMKPIGIMVDNSEVGNLSDHAMVYAACIS